MRTACLIALLLAAFSPPVLASPAELPPPLGMPTDPDLNKLEPTIQKQSDRIRQEVAALPARTDLAPDHWARHWAGTYYVGDGTGMNLTYSIAPDAGITYTWYGCLGLYGGNFGRILGAFDDDRDGNIDGVRVHWLVSDDGHLPIISERVYFVRWKGAANSPDRQYLLPESRMLGFVNGFNEGGYARERQHQAPLKYDPTQPRHLRSPASPVQGPPQLPRLWARRLLTEPLTAKVTHVEQPRTTNTNDIWVTESRLRLDKGKADGVYVGIQIRVSGWAGTLYIDKVDKHSSEGAFLLFGDASGNDRVPKVGDALEVAAGLEPVEGDKARK